MSKLDLMPGLTRTQGELEEQQRQTFKGQAHFAGTGPRGKICRECVHWGATDGVSYFADSGLLKPARCGKYRQLVGKPGPQVPYSAAACKYFEVTQWPPAAAKT